MSNTAVTQAKSNGQMTAQKTLGSILSSDGMKSRLIEVLGDSARDFTAAVLSLANSNPAIKECEPNSVINACLKAAIFKLQVDPSLSQAHIIPYKTKQGDKWVTLAQFQLGYKGIKQLCIRSGMFERMNAVPVYAGQLKAFDPLKGDYEFDWSVPSEGEPIAYAAYFRARMGTTVFEKTLVMNVGQISAHAKKYSKSFAKGFGPWVDNFPAMALKTVSKLLLNSGEAPMSVEFQRAIEADQKIIKDAVNDEFEDVDHDEVETGQIENNPEAPTTEQVDENDPMNNM